MKKTVVELTTLSPAEVSLIENPRVKIDKLAKVTLFDLILKGVLRLDIHEKSTRKEKKNPIVSTGKNFTKYQPLKHEAIFLEVFKQEPDLKIQVSDVIKSAFENVNTPRKYKFEYIYTDERLKLYFKSNFFLKLFRKRALTRKGKLSQQELKKELRRIKSNTTRESKNAAETLLAISSNIVLVPKIPSSVFKAMRKRKDAYTYHQDSYHWTDYDHSGLYLPHGTKNQFDLPPVKDSDIMDTIDAIEGFDSDDEGSSGCDSDSGCSSGCSGCGGCGGD